MSSPIALIASTCRLLISFEMCLRDVVVFRLEELGSALPGPSQGGPGDDQTCGLPRRSPGMDRLGSLVEGEADCRSTSVQGHEGPCKIARRRRFADWSAWWAAAS